MIPTNFVLAVCTSGYNLPAWRSHVAFVLGRVSCRCCLIIQPTGSIPVPLDTERCLAVHCKVNTSVYTFTLPWLTAPETVTKWDEGMPFASHCMCVSCLKVTLYSNVTCSFSDLCKAVMWKCALQFTRLGHVVALQCYAACKHCDVKPCTVGV